MHWTVERGCGSEKQDATDCRSSAALGQREGAARVAANGKPHGDDNQGRSNKGDLTAHPPQSQPYASHLPPSVFPPSSTKTVSAVHYVLRSHAARAD